MVAVSPSVGLRQGASLFEREGKKVGLTLKKFSALGIPAKATSENHVVS